MPKTEVVFYAEAGVAPVLQWLTELRHTHELEKEMGDDQEENQN